MLAIPKPMLDSLDLHANQQVGVSIVEGQIIVEPKVKPRYILAELMAQCDLEQPMTAEDREWLDEPPAGKEGI